jgi:mono/diheme cytochrome c family protein
MMHLRLIALATSLVSTAVVAEPTENQVARGKYLVTAGDCVACHLSPDGKRPLAGGRPLETPFGKIYPPNITPHKQTGIGDWSYADFERAMRRGISKDGSHLYPAFPYPYYTKASGEDIHSIYTYLMTVEPVEAARKTPEFSWPLNQRAVNRGWNLLYFAPGEFRADSAKSAEWNRGAYLTLGLGHCGGCHTPKNALGADKKSEHLKGGNLNGWFAPNLTSDSMKGLRDWSVEDITEYLKHGRNGFAQAGGPMAEVVQHSTSGMTIGDLRAIAIYLKELPGDAKKPLAPVISAPVMAAGADIYIAQCSSCHTPNGEGVRFMFPALSGGGVAVQDDPTSVIRVILRGARTVATDKYPTPSSMPAYDWKLSDEEIASVATYVRNSWGNAASRVSPHEVKLLRAKTQARAQAGVK